MFPSHLRSHGRPHLFRDLGRDPEIPPCSLGPAAAWRGAVRHETRRREYAVINLLLLGPVAASYKIKARKAPSTTRRELSAQQLRAGHGRARGGQLGAMVVAQLLFALLRRWSRPSDQTVSRHRVSYRILRALALIGNPATSSVGRRPLVCLWDTILRGMSNGTNLPRRACRVREEHLNIVLRVSSTLKENIGVRQMRDAIALPFLKIILISVGVKFCARCLARNFTQFWRYARYKYCERIIPAAALFSLAMLARNPWLMREDLPIHFRVCSSLPSERNHLVSLHDCSRYHNSLQLHIQSNWNRIKRAHGLAKNLITLICDIMANGNKSNELGKSFIEMHRNEHCIWFNSAKLSLQRFLKFSALDKMLGTHLFEERWWSFINPLNCKYDRIEGRIE
jgi:hypothetical protein